MRLRRRLLLSLLFLAGAAAAASPAARLSTSATAAPLARSLAEQFGERGQRIDLVYAGSEQAIEDLRAGKVDCALIGRPLAAAETREFHAATLATDSLLLIVNERNPLRRADTALIHRIFSRELSDWSQVGTERNGPIVPVTRRSVDGTRTVFDKAFHIGRVIPTGIVELGSNLAAILYIAADPQAIGYASAGAFDDGQRRGLRIQAVSIDGQAPDANACDSTTYPLCRPILLVRRADRPQRGCAQIEEFFAAEAGRELLKRHGFSVRGTR